MKVLGKNKKAWGGRFAKKSNPLLDQFNASLAFDKRLYAEDIDGSLAHARMLKKIGVLKVGELKKVENGLEKIRKEIEAGKFKWSDELEDIHMAIEARLTQLIGPVGGKVHTARSRNDQVALDLRLYCKRRLPGLIKSIIAVQKALVAFASKQGFIPMPGYTHLQRAQPVYLAHHLLAYFEMLERDKARFQETSQRVNVCPLGSGALAGTTFPIDRKFVAKQLGFKTITNNSLDAVSDRDFVAEILFNIGLMMAHFSRLSEELILWSSQEFGFISLPQEYCTGSSMMPQKVNPDVPELIRGKTGRTYGNLMALLTVIKGLPLAYNKDLQEDKEALFDSMDTAFIVLEILDEIIKGIKICPDTMRQATEEGFLLATDLADYLVSRNVPFRQAHEIVGKLVQYSIKNQKTLERLSLKEFNKFSSVFKPDVKAWLKLETSLNRRRSPGGTAASQVKKELMRAKKALGR